ncbi:Zinc finger C3HC4 type [Trichostrongylus colubriformis]|uniref:Zinc finger C3HC4 type n=1 Tax=Trichostrongylus colubriformis TaxID=6319 RepID=A0AAN8FFY9_TRICO
MANQEHYEPQQNVEGTASRMFTNCDRVSNVRDVRISVEDREDFASISNPFSQETGDYYLNNVGRRTAGRQMSSRSVIEAADRLRMEYARLQQTIYQNQDAQSLCTMVSAVIPFVFLFTVKVLMDNFLPIMRIAIALGGFLAVDSRVQHLFAAGHTAVSIRVTTVIIFLVLFYFTSGLCFRDDDFDMKNALLLKYAGVVYHGFFFTLYVLILTDTFIKMVVSGTKLLVSLCGVRMGTKRKINQFLEYSSQMYRCVVPIPQWMHYFIGSYVSDFALYSNGLLFSVYGVIKARELWGLAQTTLECASQMICPRPYGDFPSDDDVGMREMCSVCHENFSSPIKLSCSHIFCTSCIDRWLECENTCPICRAVVEKKNNSWKNGATSKGIRLC